MKGLDERTELLLLAQPKWCFDVGMMCDDVTSCYSWGFYGIDALAAELLSCDCGVGSTRAVGARIRDNFDPD